jgi:hypothetical protein
MLLLGITLSTSADDFAPPTPTIANGVKFGRKRKL